MHFLTGFEDQYVINETTDAGKAVKNGRHPFLEELRSQRDAKWKAAIAVSTGWCNERDEALGSFVQWYSAKPTVWRALRKPSHCR